MEYEVFLDLCYTCGIIGHTYKLYEKKVAKGAFSSIARACDAFLIEGTRKEAMEIGIVMGAVLACGGPRGVAAGC